MRANTMANRCILLTVAAIVTAVVHTACVLAAEPAITTYGTRNAAASGQLNMFSFLVGKWQGSGRTRLADGSYAQFAGVTWIGRYILDGTAIADEFHASTPDGKAYLGISLRQFDAAQKSWIVEYLNVTNSFLRRQVNPRSGSVTSNGDTVVVVSGDAQTNFRETYRLTDKNHYIYSADSSRDGGRNWDPASIEISMVRVE
jgi:hypothetical protein